MSSQSTTSTTTTPVSLRNLTRPLHAGVILLGGTTELLDIAPIDILGGLSKDFVSMFPDGMLSDEVKGQAVEVVIHYVSEHAGVAKVTGGMEVKVTDTFDSCPPLDITLIGATMPPYTPTSAELSFLRSTFNSPVNQAFLTICAGMMPALQAGLLSNRRATAPRPMLAQLRREATDVKWSERRWERDGKLWTSGTLLNGLDMMRAWVGSVWGAEGGDEKVDGEMDGEGVGEGKERLADFVLDFGGWPVRDVEYRDERGEGKGIKIAI